MVQDVKPKVDWAWVKERIENGIGYRAICRDLKARGTPYAHQNLSKKARAKGWVPVQSIPGGTPGVKEPSPASLIAAVPTPPRPKTGKRTQENMNEILRLMREGASQNAAAKALGISSSNMSHWKQRNAKFSQQIEAARWHALGGTQRAIWRAGVDRGDWRAAAHYLAHAPETKQEWGADEGAGAGGIRIEFKFDRPLPPMIDVTPKKGE